MESFCILIAFRWLFPASTFAVKRMQNPINIVLAVFIFIWLSLLPSLLRGILHYVFESIIRHIVRLFKQLFFYVAIAFGQFDP